MSFTPEFISYGVCVALTGLVSLLNYISAAVLGKTICGKEAAWLTDEHFLCQ